MAELKSSVNKSNESAAGPDGVYYQFLRHLPESCLHTLLKHLDHRRHSPVWGPRKNWLHRGCRGLSKLSLAGLFEQLPKPFLVLGDFNAHSPAWGDSRRDGRGRMLEFTAENDLIILNSGEQTFIHSAYHSTSAIDLAVASPSIAAECS
ncbi:retrovirus-related pol polyprotein [Plakobranchus ocellatus]|uniref:Retrovirus-related pol polyprotein n=1 Tax=Plakobranchus ocellatus TaxID=259542 RepID=A0AAV3YWA2_9GAST|nr:retrovirus-related pol polyprotein [Plakobranchus ocellatus]